MVKEKNFKASLYLRLSREDGDKNESNSIANQKSLLLEFVSRNPDIEVVSIRVDDGYTGTNFNRPDFKNMLKDIQDGVVDCVIVKDLSRFGRDYIETGRYLQQIFPSYGVRFISLAENFDTFNIVNSNQEDMVAFYNIVNEACFYKNSCKS